MNQHDRSEWVIDRLRKSHQRDEFDCGVQELNEFLQLYARQNQDADISRTWVATKPDTTRVLGFYTLSAASIARTLLPKSEGRLPLYPVPAVHLGRLAVARTVGGRGLGATLLMHALEQVLRISDVMGVRVVEVRAKDTRARAFYEHFGFVRLVDDPLHLYLGVKKVAAVLGD